MLYAIIWMFWPAARIPYSAQRADLRVTAICSRRTPPPLRRQEVSPCSIESCWQALLWSRWVQLDWVPLGRRKPVATTIITTTAGALPHLVRRHMALRPIAVRPTTAAPTTASIPPIQFRPTAATDTALITEHRRLTGSTAAVLRFGCRLASSLPASYPSSLLQRRSETRPPLFCAGVFRGVWLLGGKCFW